MKKLTITGILIIFALAFTGCISKKEDNTMKDGCYTAQMQEYSYGWKEYVTITVKNGKIVSTEFDAENASGFIKSWDNAYMNNMKPVSGTYPNEYTRYYAAQLTGQSEAPEIDAITGATSSAVNFQALSKAVVEQAIQGDSSVVFVKSSK